MIQHISLRGWFLSGVIWVDASQIVSSLVASKVLLLELTRAWWASTVGMLPDIQCLYQGVTEKSLNKCFAGELTLHHPEKSQGVSTLLISVDSWGQDRRLAFCREKEDRGRCDQGQPNIVVNYEAIPLWSYNDVKCRSPDPGPRDPIFHPENLPFFLSFCIASVLSCQLIEDTTSEVALTPPRLTHSITVSIIELIFPRWSEIVK